MSHKLSQLQLEQGHAQLLHLRVSAQAEARSIGLSPPNTELFYDPAGMLTFKHSIWFARALQRRGGCERRRWSGSARANSQVPRGILSCVRPCSPSSLAPTPLSMPWLVCAPLSVCVCVCVPPASCFLLRHHVPWRQNMPVLSLCLCTHRTFSRHTNCDPNCTGIQQDCRTSGRRWWSSAIC